MWLVTYQSSHLQKKITCYFKKQATAQNAYRKLKFSNTDVKLIHDPSFEMQDWEKDHG